MWSIDTDHARLQPPIVGASRFFADAGCVGPPYVVAEPVRWVVSAAGVDGGFARADWQPAEVFNQASSTDGVTCFTSSGLSTGVRFDRMTPVTTPVLNAIAPLHLEQR
jgi:hypothetical protein